MHLEEVIKTRTSVREFSDQKVDKETIKKILESARWAPSACNLQLTEYIVIDQDEIRLNLTSKVTNKLKWAPVYLVVIYDKRFSKNRSAAFTSLGLAVENILLTAHSFGLGTCPISGFTGDNYLRCKLKIPEFYEIALLIALGYPADEIKKDRERIDSRELIHWNQFKKENLLNDSLKLDDWTVNDIINYRRRLASVYLYKKINRLAPFNNSVYVKIYDIFLAGLNHQPGVKTVVDLISYDGKFIDLLDKNIFSPIATDYLNYILNIIKQKNNCQIAKINLDNTLTMADGIIDVVTYIHKLEFTPATHIQKVIKEAYRVLKPGGIIFITTIHETWSKRLSRLLFKYYLKLFTKKIVNVYENNPFYKIGPFKQRPTGFIKQNLKSAGFKIKSIGKEKVPQNGKFAHHRFNWFYFYK